MDRTGQVSGSYMVQYLDIPFATAWNYDNNCIENRTMSFWSEAGFQWYCEHLYITQNPFLDCSTPPPVTPGSVNCLPFKK